MGRPIKIRAWDTDEKEIVTWDALRDTQLLEDGFDGKDCILMQFTGLLDRDGREIYEGDVVRGQVYEYHGDFEVTFDEGAFSLRVSADYSPCLYEGIPETQLEVIGNIYENPGLLK